MAQRLSREGDNMSKIRSSRRSGFGVTVATVATITGALALASLTSAGASSRLENQSMPTIVLVHGAWADGSSWNKVSAQLQAKGYDVRVPPDNLRGVASDADHLVSYLKTITGPVVL